MELNTARQREAFSQKSTYTIEEKKYIMERLNTERRIQQKKISITLEYTQYSQEEKKNILYELNEKRLESQHYAEIAKQRTRNKKIYVYDMLQFYKFLNMDREYFILIEDIQKLSTRPLILTLYNRVFGELKKKDFLIKVMPYSNRVHISNDMLRVYFKSYTLEDQSKI